MLSMKTFYRPAAVPALAVTVLLATGCSGGGSPASSNTIPKAAGSPSTTSAGGSDQTAVLAALGACFRQHGVNMADPTISANGQLQMDRSVLSQVPTNVISAAAQACAAQVQALRLLVPKKPSLVPQEVKFSECMRQHGIANFPDPDPAGGGFPIRQQGIDETTPAFQAAQQACQSLLPSGSL
jgi:hypothetical protein